VTVACDGIDPITGLPWPSETFDVNVGTSEGNDPTDPKDTLGIFKKEGLPEGNCTVTIVAVSDDGTMQCAGQMVDIPVVAGPTNTFVTIVINCITDARYGGIERSWGTPVLIGTGGSAQVAVDPSGSVTAVWNGPGGIWSNRYPVDGLLQNPDDLLFRVSLPFHL